MQVLLEQADHPIDGVAGSRPLGGVRQGRGDRGQRVAHCRQVLHDTVVEVLGQPPPLLVPGAQRARHEVGLVSPCPVDATSERPGEGQYRQLEEQQADQGDRDGLLGDRVPFVGDPVGVDVGLEHDRPTLGGRQRDVHLQQVVLVAEARRG